MRPIVPETHEPYADKQHPRAFEIRVVSYGSPSNEIALEAVRDDTGKTPLHVLSLHEAPSLDLLTNIVVFRRDARSRWEQVAVQVARPAVTGEACRQTTEALLVAVLDSSVEVKVLIRIYDYYHFARLTESLLPDENPNQQIDHAVRFDCANRPEFLGDVNHRLTAKLGLNYKLSPR
jgi:hypothetical protein